MSTSGPLGRLARSAFAFPWALSLLGIQQAASVFRGTSEGRIAAATGALDKVARATREPAGAWREQSWQTANALRRAIVDLTRVRPRSIDSGGLTALAADPPLAPLAATMAGLAVPPVAWLDSFRVASGDSATLLREVANKLRIMRVAADARTRLRVDRQDGEPLRKPLERAARLDSFARLWAVEALGTWYADRALARAKGGDPECVLTGEPAVPAWSLMMLHAGIGTSFAAEVLAGLTPEASGAVTRTAISRFIRLCRRSSHTGYAGAAFEAFGFAARMFRGNFVRLLDREIANVDPGLLGYFWHGVGRAMYFAPNNLLPSANAPRTAIDGLEEDMPHELACRNALAGIAWSTTLANLQDPDVMELLLAYHGAFAGGAPAFSNGVSSAVVVRSMTTPDDPSVTPFIEYQASSGAAGAAAWRSLIAVPCRDALDRRSLHLQRTGAFEDLFHYRPSPA